jgi:hypothetical protein
MMPRVSFESAMKTLWFVAVVACIAGANACHAQEAVDNRTSRFARPENLRLLCASL